MGEGSENYAKAGVERRKYKNDRKNQNWAKVRARKRGEAGEKKKY